MHKLKDIEHAVRVQSEYVKLQNLVEDSPKRRETVKSNTYYSDPDLISQELLEKT